MVGRLYTSPSALKRSTWLVLTLFVGLAACESAVLDPLDRTEPIDLTRAWELADPEQVAIDGDALDRAAGLLESEPRALSLLVVREGRLAYERYFHGNRSDSLNDVRSVTKSVVSTLVGIGVEEGLIESLDDTLGALLPPEQFTLTDAQKAISIRHLLTMSAGFEWTESGAVGYVEWITSDDQVRFLLDRPVADVPGSTFNYNSAAVHLLGVVLEEVAGEPLPDLAQRLLFDPLGVARVRWEPVSNGYHNGGSGIDLRPRDLARLGQLALQNGVTGNTALTEPDWFTRAATPAFSSRFQAPGVAAGAYGHLWWTDSGLSVPTFFAWGFGGQYVYVAPALDLVVVATTEWRGVGSEAQQQAGRVLRVIVEEVLPAAR